MNNNITVYIEMPKYTNIKYEFDHTINALRCDRILTTPVSIPFNYGFIPNTLSGDGDPLDILLYMNEILVPGCYISCRIIGALETTDEKGIDTKIIAVPDSSVSKEYDHINDVSQLPQEFIKKLIYYYQHYKDLENKVVTIGQLLGHDDAINIYNSTINAN
jgi:inorganic pyrophosphatase